MKVKMRYLIIFAFIAFVISSRLNASSSYAEFFKNVEESLLKEDKFYKLNNPETLLCLKNSSISESMRFFLYKRYINLSKARLSENVFQNALREKFETMSYLACRESGGRAVAQVPHEKEKEKKACFYGSTYEELQTAIEAQLTLRTNTGVAIYFNHETNGGPFQVSADQVDNNPDEFDPELIAHRYFTSMVQKLSESPLSSAHAYCRTSERFDIVKEKEIPHSLYSSLQNMAAYIQSRAGKKGIWFRDVDDIKLFHELQTLCPMLHFEIAMMLHHLKGKYYYGPLNNTKRAEECGSTFSLCGPVFDRLQKILIANTQKKLTSK